MKYNLKNKKAQAITQIIILLISIIAISWTIGSEVQEVSAAGGTSSTSSSITPPTIICMDKCIDGNVWSQKVDASGKNCVKNQLTKNCNGAGCLGAYCNPPKLSQNLRDPSQNTDIPQKVDLSDKVVQQGGSMLKGIVSTAVGSEIKNTLKGTTTKVKIPGADGVEKEVEVISRGPWGDFLFGHSATGTAAEKELGLEVGQWTGVGGESAIGAAGSVVLWSAIAFLVGRYIIGPAIGLSVHNSQALGTALALGTAAGLTASSAVLMNIIGASSVGGPVGIVIGAAVALVTAAFLWRNASADVIQVPCAQWEAQDGREVGSIADKKARCEMCNKEAGNLPCTEYQCRSLGVGCKLINEENSGKQLCIWNNPNDITPPVITPLNLALDQANFKYTPDKATSPPDTGVIVYYNGSTDVTKVGDIRCAPAYTRVSFGVSLDEAAKCKISTVNQNNYLKMNDIYMGSGIYSETQSFILSLPSKEALEAQNITVENGKNYSLFVRCQDANGNANVANFVFKFCINQGPDRTAPQIVTTSPFISGQPIAYNQASVPIQLYTNEPAECKWSFADKEYNLMENNMTCKNSATDINSQLLYTCNANLTGLKNGQNNNYYFRCKDQPFFAKTDKENLRNANKASYPLTLVGTKPLIIRSAGPNNTVIEDSSDVVKVELTAETFAGAKDGNAICSFSETGVEKSYVDFLYEYETEPYSQHIHTQDLWLSSGEYHYYIRCRDKGGNIDTKDIKFNVSTDTVAPMVVRVFNEDNYLKIITDEPAECAYSTSTCNFDLSTNEDGEQGEWDANLMSSEGDKSYADWNINFNYYIKCKDEYGNRPSPSQCSIVVRPFDLLEAQ